MKSSSKRPRSVSALPHLQLYFLLLIMFLLAFCPVALGQEKRNAWSLIHGSERTLPHRKIAQIYLPKATTKIVRDSKWDETTRTSRLIIGTPTSNRLVKTVLEQLDIKYSDSRLTYQGQTIEGNAGLVVLTDDPDGEGRLALVTGMTDAGVLANFQTNLPYFNRHRGYFVIRNRRVIAKGPIGLKWNTSRPRVVRLDRDFLRLCEEAQNIAGDENVLRIANGLIGYKQVFQAMGSSDLFAMLTDQLKNKERIEHANDFFADRDLTKEITNTFSRTEKLLGGLDGPKPIYFVIYGALTNAKTFDHHPQTGRPQVALNLLSLSRGNHWEAAVAHETVHTFQDVARAKTLLAKCVNEGVATYLGQQINPTSDEDALFWSQEELAAAESRFAAIYRAFDEEKLETNPERIKPFIMLETPLRSVRGAPSRTGYYLAFRACKAWCESNPGKPASALLRATPEEIWAALHPPN